MTPPLSQKECSFTPLWFDTADCLDLGQGDGTSKWEADNTKALTRTKKTRRRFKYPSGAVRLSPHAGKRQIILPLSRLECAGASRPSPYIAGRRLFSRAPGASNSPFRSVRMDFEISMPCENRPHRQGRLQVSTSTNRFRKRLTVFCQHKVAWSSQCCWSTSSQICCGVF